MMTERAGMETPAMVDRAIRVSVRNLGRADFAGGLVLLFFNFGYNLFLDV
jgi:hypothetical protein